jgi:putative redox protein
MTAMQATLRLRTVEGDGLRFEAAFPSGTVVLDSGPDCTAPNPVQHLLAAIAACEAMDVISLLRKKRQQVTAYEVEMTGERAEDHPRRFTAITLVHRLTGRRLSRAAAEDSLRLTVEKYCSVYHCLRPDLPVTQRLVLVEG